QRCKADAARVAGSTGMVGAAKFAALAAAKKDAETVDETKKALHNFVSLLQTTQRRWTAKPAAKFFNNQTTDKCGRW
ncbi:hypothetical protein ACWM6E_29660, partial [Cupriavidus necator]